MKNHDGFSLLELLILLVIIGFVMALVNFSIPSKTSFQSDTFLGVFAQDLRLTQVLSMSQNQRYRIVIGASSYQILNQNGVAISHPETGAASIVYPTGLTLTPATTVIFDSLGQPYDGSSAALTSTLTFTISSGGNSKTVSITPQTGFIQ